MHENIRLFSKDIEKRNYAKTTPDVNSSPQVLELRKQISEYTALEEKYKRQIENRGMKIPDQDERLTTEEYMDLVLEKTEDVIRIIIKQTDEQIEKIFSTIQEMENETDKKINEVDDRINKKKHVISMLNRLIKSIDEDTEKIESIKGGVRGENSNFNETAKKIKEVYDRIDEISNFG